MKKICFDILIHSNQDINTGNMQSMVESTAGNTAGRREGRTVGRMEENTEGNTGGKMVGKMAGKMAGNTGELLMEMPLKRLMAHHNLLSL